MQKKSSKFLALLLALMMVVSVLPVSVLAADEATTATLVTDAADIAAGDKVVIVAAEYDYALSTNQKPNNRGAAAITKTDGSATLTDEVQVLTLENGSVDGTFAFNTGDGYLYAAGTSKAQNNSKNLNYLKTETTLSANSSWKISITDGVASVIAQGENGCNIMQYNTNSTLFAAYSSAQADVAIYKVGTASGENPAPEVTPTPEPSPEPAEKLLADGDYVIYAPAYGKALSATKTGNYNAGVDVTLTEGVMSGYGDNEVWTVTNNDDGTITIENGGQKLSMAASYSSMTMDAVNDTWEVIELGNELYNVKNVGRGNYMEWYAKYSNWSTYNSSYAATDGQFQLSFYPVPVDNTVIADGDYVIYAPAYGKALSATKTGNYNAGVDVTLTEGVMSGYGDNEVWTVTNNDDGTITIENGGQKLSMAASYSSMTMDAVNDTWEVIELGNELYNVKNVGRGNYMEWYAKYSNWSTYNSSYAATDGQFQLAFYPVPEDNSIIPDGNYVIYAPAYSKALSATKTGNYNAGVDITLTDGVMSGFGINEVWTVTNNDDGTIYIENSGQKLSMAASYSSMAMDEVNDTWEVIELGNELYNVKNVGRGNYMEWYAKYSNWSTYNSSYAATDGQFQLAFYPVPDEDMPGTSGSLTAGSSVVIYNLSAKGVLAAENDTQSIENALAEIVDGKAVPENGGVVFTVSKNGDYWRFYNETYGYLCSNGTGNNAFYSPEASEDADWLALDGKSGGYNLESRTAKYNGKYSQYLEYYADSYKTYSMYNVTDYDIYEFFFYPVGEDVNVTSGIVNDPKVVFGSLEDAYVGMDYSFSFTVDAVFGIDGEIVVKAGEKTLTANEDGSYTIPAEDVSGTTIAIAVTGKDTMGVAISGSADVAVKDEPVITDITPAANSQTGDDRKPLISATVVNAGPEPMVTMEVNGEAVEAEYTNGVVSYTPASDMDEGRTTVSVKVIRSDGKETEKNWSFVVGEAQYELYFGQLHSHTTYSDGSGSLESALSYIKSLPNSANVDFVAFTDHSNYFDASGAANPEAALYDMSLATADSQKLWSQYVGAMEQFNSANSDILAIPGFEMTWSGGPGHINTFNTEGIVSRNNTTLNNKTADAGMKAYYALLSQAEGADSINQFNHPGTTFGNFVDFAYWDAVIDTRIQLVEVGNGEGAVGAGGYYPSFEQYTLALDKGWHVAPTNNQDNHKGKWGNANDARDVILTDDFTLEGLYEAIRNYRVYATEDKNLEINYTVNNMLMGSVIEEVPEKLNVSVSVYDPDRSDSISKVEVIVNSGKTAYVWDSAAELAAGVLSAELEPSYSYYYIRVTEGDGDIAVTAPVWVGETLKLGISSVTTTTATPVTGEELTITTGFFNSESADATVKYMTYTVGGQVIGTDDTVYTIPASGTASVDFAYTPDTAKLTTVTVTAVVEQEGVEYTFSMDIELDVQDADKLVYIGIDASHYNEYVNGNYKDNMGNFSLLAAEYSVRTVTLYESADLIEACSNDKYVALILTAPSRRSSEAQSSEPLKVYTAEELAAIKSFNDNGGTVILAGWSDHYENYPDVASIAGMKAEEHMAATQNAVLEALGSSLRIADDATYDDTYNGGQAYRLYFNSYNFDSFLVEGVEVDAQNPHDRLYTEVYSHYGGASVYTVPSALPSTVTPIVFGHSGTYSVDVDKDGLGGSSMPKYSYAEGDDRLMVLASEQLEGKGLIIVSGAAFMSNFEVQATIEDSGSEKNYSNYKICENLLAYLNPVPVTPIAEVQAQTEAGYKYTIEGIVTSNASGYDKDTAFFDCIYVQDETGGICCFPVAGNFKIGDKVRVTGTTEFYQGEMELQVTDIEVIGSGSVEAKSVKASQVNDGSVIGQLINIKGVVVSYEMANGLVQTIMVKDGYGGIARVFIDGYITTDEDVKNLAVGNIINVTGLASYDNTFNAPEGPFPRIRIRDRADIVCTEFNYTPEETPEVVKFPFTDVVRGNWFYEDVYKLWAEGIMNGVSDTLFAPHTVLNRAMFATMIYRLSGETYAGELDSFEDVEQGKWYTEAIAWCAEKGIVTGFSETVFGPERPVTREQAVAMLYRYANYKGYDVSVGEKTGLDAFADAESVSDYAVPAMKWAVGAGIIKGMTENTIAPTESSTRAQVACMFSRFVNWCE